MKSLIAFFCLLSIGSTAFAQSEAEAKKTTCYVYGVKEKGEFLDEKQSVSASVESDQYMVYVGVREEGSSGRGLVQVMSKETGRPLSTNYFDIVSMIELNTNVADGKLITVSCDRR